ncbi:transcriptional regulator [Kitasatospora hibisci]|uniref:transcriptional regulator n=1 Tax=Kitasatospora hibisci TaxID=3369522 RepID=UPI0037551E0D
MSGTVGLPLHLARPGLRAFDLDRPRLRTGLYRILLTEGMHEDLVRFLNGGLLVEQRPALRTLVGPAVRAGWENAFTEPEAAARTAAAG